MNAKAIWIKPHVTYPKNLTNKDFQQDQSYNNECPIQLAGVAAWMMNIQIKRLLQLHATLLVNTFWTCCKYMIQLHIFQLMLA